MAYPVAILSESQCNNSKGDDILMKNRFTIEYVSDFPGYTRSRFYGLLCRAVTGVGMRMADLVIGETLVDDTRHTRKVYDSIRAMAVMRMYCDDYVANESIKPAFRARTAKQYDWALEELQRLSF